MLVAAESDDEFADMIGSHIADRYRMIASSAAAAWGSSSPRVGSATVLLESPSFAHHLARQWMGLIDAGLALESSG